MVGSLDCRTLKRSPQHSAPRAPGRQPGWCRNRTAHETRLAAAAVGLHTTHSAPVGPAINVLESTSSYTLIVLHLRMFIRKLIALIPGTGDALHAALFEDNRGVTFRTFTGV